MTPQEYRLKHHRCKYCEYSRLVKPPPHICSDYFKCLVKSKIISESFWDLKGIFCKVYKPKEIDFDI